MDAKPGPQLEATTRRRFLGGLAATGLLAAGGCASVAQTRFDLHVTQHTVALPLARTGSLTIAHLTDLHLSPWIPRDYLADTVDQCNRLRPDLTVLTGDFISQSIVYAPPCAELVGRLRAPLGVFAVLGNHDHWLNAETVTEALMEAGVTPLTNRAARLPNGAWLVGIDDVWAGRPRLAVALQSVPLDAPLVLLSHNPRGFDRLADRPALVLSGHTHGGQVALPGVKRVLPPDMAGTPYVEGWYRDGAKQMYVSRGVGMVFPPVRFRVPPEFSLFTI